MFLVVPFRLLLLLLLTIFLVYTVYIVYSPSHTRQARDNPEPLLFTCCRHSSAKPQDLLLRGSTAPVLVQVLLLLIVGQLRKPGLLVQNGHLESRKLASVDDCRWLFVDVVNLVYLAYLVYLINLTNLTNTVLALLNIGHRLKNSDTSAGAHLYLSWATGNKRETEEE
jgi:hypothetical protein